MKDANKWPRGSGILVHPTSFPGSFGIGDLGPSAVTWLEYLAASGQKYWQVLPLGPTGYGNSPYATLSAFAGNPILISLERLVEDGLLAQSEIEDHPHFPANHVDFGTVVPWKMALLRASFDHFKDQKRFLALRAPFEAFCKEHHDWLDDYALFAALKNVHHGAAWVEWDPALAAHEPVAVAEAQQKLRDEIAFQQYLQFLFFRQWSAIRQAAHERQISIIGDLAIFVAHDSADVWAHRDLFQLDAHGQPSVVAGVPPDYFSATGQRWGNPLYRWDVLQANDYAWWIARVRRALELEDIIRLDHFRGFEAYWEIPGNDKTAVNGRWVQGPGDLLFTAIRHALGDIPFIAEDLGVITPEVDALREQLGFPGMRVLQFAFGGDANNHHLPHNYTLDAVVYTGTHDNDTSAAWFEACSERERRHALRYLHITGDEIVWVMIRAALASVAAIAVLPLQDALSLGSEARMNYPSRAAGNWEWRYTERQLTHTISKRLANLCALYGRS